MAGIGFELRKLLNKGSLISQLQAYSYAGIISSGPWVLSILGILLIGLLSTEQEISLVYVAQFQVSVTYLMAVSLILTGPLQLLFTRFVSDRIYEKQDAIILPNLLGVITLVTLVSGALGVILLLLFFSGSLIYQLSMLTGFVTLCNIWIVVVLLSAIKEWKLILFSFFIGYSITVGASLSLRPYGLEGLMIGFLLGHGILFFLLLAQVLRSYPGRRFIAFEFFNLNKVFLSLAFTGFFYNFAIWADKLIFWFNPFTSTSVIGPLRISPIYDLPIFLAYLSIVPGMAVFLIRMETDFAEQHEAFYNAIREGDTLDNIFTIKSKMISTLRKGIYEIFKVQGLTILILFALGDHLLRWFDISPLYRLLFNVDIVAVGVQLLLLVILNILFYFDQRRVVLQITLLFLLSNIFLTLLSQYLGPVFYGYGFASALVLSSIIGLAILIKKLDHIEYETFMLQPVKI